MANFQIKAYTGPSLENGHIEFPSLYLSRLDSADKKNQHVVIDGFGSTDLGLTSIVDCGIYDGAGDNAKLVARAKGMRMNADHSWCNLFVIVFELDGFKGSTLAVMGATMEKAGETSIEEKGEWAIVGGTGEFAMARGLITRKGRQVVPGGEILELSLEAYCRTTKVLIPPAVAPPATPTTPAVRAHKEFKGSSHEVMGATMEKTGTLLSCMVDAQGCESVLKMQRRAFNYICGLVKDDMIVRDNNSYTFVDGRVLCLEDQVFVALIMLNAGETLETVGSSVCVNESTVSLITERFVDAMRERALHHRIWPGPGKMEKVKSKFDKILDLPNCCGVLHTTHIPFGSENCDHEGKDCLLMQTVVDPDMRFRNIWLGSDNMDQLSLLHDSELFKECDKGPWLNGNKLELSPAEGSEVGEYIIGGAGYPLLPWLLTPYQQQGTDELSDSQVEFNRRHSTAVTLALKALARLTDTWKCLQGGRPKIPCELWKVIYACCILHNIVIDMEEAPMARDYEVIYSEQVRGLAEEDAVRARDLLSQHFTRRSSESQAKLTQMLLAKSYFAR